MHAVAMIAMLYYQSMTANLSNFLLMLIGYSSEHMEPLYVHLPPHLEPIGTQLALL